jgi:hypothetical protein
LKQSIGDIGRHGEAEQLFSRESTRAETVDFVGVENINWYCWEAKWTHIPPAPDNSPNTSGEEDDDDDDCAAIPVAAMWSNVRITNRSSLCKRLLSHSKIEVSGSSSAAALELIFVSLS